MADRWSNRLLTKEEYVDKARSIWGEQYDYSESKYLSGMKPITIRCKKHNHYFTLKAAGSHILTPRKYKNRWVFPRGCPLCSKERREQRKPVIVKEKKQPVDWRKRFIEKAQLVYPDYDYSKVIYKGAEVPVKIVCPKHGEFSLSPRALLRGSHGVGAHGCPYCCGILQPKKPIKEKRVPRYVNFIEEASKVHGDRYEYIDLPKSSKQRIWIKCKVHGMFLQRADCHLRGSNCPHCVGYRSLPVDNRKATFIQKSQDRYGERFDYSQVVYVNKKTPVKIRCKEHDYWFEVLPDTHVRRNSGCPICSDSVGEVEVRLWLDKHHVLYEVQHVIPNENPACKRSHLRVDFWLPIHNIIIEFHGQQHFENIPHFYNNREWTFKDQQIRDQTLRDYCKKMSIRLIEICYKDIDKIPLILKKAVSSIP